MPMVQSKRAATSSIDFPIVQCWVLDWAIPALDLWMFALCGQQWCWHTMSEVCLHRGWEPSLTWCEKCIICMHWEDGTNHVFDHQIATVEPASHHQIQIAIFDVCRYTALHSNVNLAQFSHKLLQRLSFTCYCLSRLSLSCKKLSSALVWPWCSVVAVLAGMLSTISVGIYIAFFCVQVGDGAYRWVQNLMFYQSVQHSGKTRDSRPTYILYTCVANKLPATQEHSRYNALLLDHLYLYWEVSF